MHPDVMLQIAHDRAADFQRNAANYRRTREASHRPIQPVRAAIELRLSACRDELERLAALSQRRLGGGDWLVADVNGVPVAAVSLDNGSTVYDPFKSTSQAVSLLKLRRKQVLAAA
jgi:hypothetical protein